MTKRMGGCFTPNWLSPLDKRVGLRLESVQFGVARVIHCKDGRVKAQAQAQARALGAKNSGLRMWGPHSALRTQNSGLGGKAKKANF